MKIFEISEVEPGPEAGMMIRSEDFPELPTNLSSSDAVKKLAGALCGLIFDGGGFEEMIASSGLGMFAGAAKPLVRKRAVASIEAIGEPQAVWIIDQIHRLSWQFENETGVFSPYHYEAE